MIPREIFDTICPKADQRLAEKLWRMADNWPDRAPEDTFDGLRVNTYEDFVGGYNAVQTVDGSERYELAVEMCPPAVAVASFEPRRAIWRYFFHPPLTKEQRMKFRLYITD
jgi:hypothetical protein